MALPGIRGLAGLRMFPRGLAAPGGGGGSGVIDAVTILGDAVVPVSIPANATPAGLTEADVGGNGALAHVRFVEPVAPGDIDVSKFSMVVSHRVWNSDGSTGTGTTTYHAVGLLRTPIPGATSSSEKYQPDANSVVFVLDEYLHNAGETDDEAPAPYNDVVSLVSVAAGIYPGADASMFSGTGVVRQDSRPYSITRPLSGPINHMKGEPFRGSGNVCEFRATSKWGRNGQMVACIEAYVKDSANADTAIVRASQETVSQWSGSSCPSGLYQPAYSVSFDVTARADGAAGVYWVTKPWRGPKVKSEDVGTDTAADYKPTPPKRLLVCIDNGNTHTWKYYRIRPDNSVGRSATDTAGFFDTKAAALADTGFANWTTAAQAGKLMNNARGHNDVAALWGLMEGVDQTGGGLGSQTGGQHPNGTSQGTTSTFNQTNMPIGLVTPVIEGVPIGGDLSTVRIITKTGMSTNQRSLLYQCKLKNLMIDHAAGASPIYVAFDPTGTTKYPEATQPMLILEDVVSNGSYGLGSHGALYGYRWSLQNCTSTGNSLGRWVGRNGDALLIGCDLRRTGAGGVVGTQAQIAGICVLASKVDAGITNSTTSLTDPADHVQEFVIHNSVISADNASVGWANGTPLLNYYIKGIHLVGSAFRCVQGSSGSFMSIHADSPGGPLVNTLISQVLVPSNSGNDANCRFNHHYDEYGWLRTLIESTERFSAYARSGQKGGTFNDGVGVANPGVYNSGSFYAPGQATCLTASAGNRVWFAKRLVTPGNSPTVGGDANWYDAGLIWGNAYSSNTMRMGNLINRHGVSWRGMVNGRPADSGGGGATPGPSAWISEVYPPGSGGQSGVQRWGANDYTTWCVGSNSELGQGATALSTRSDLSPNPSGGLWDMRPPGEAQDRFDMLGRLRTVDAWGPAGALEPSTATLVTA